MNLVGAAAESVRKRVIIREQVESMLNDGMSLDAICEHIGCRRDSLIRAMRKWGIGKRRYAVLSEEDRALAIRLVEDGVPFTWIAETVGLHSIKIELKWVQEAVAKRRAAGHTPDDWLKVWPSILHNADLLRLHHAISPRNSDKGTIKVA